MKTSVETSAANYRNYDRLTTDKHQVFAVVGSQYDEGATYSSIRIAEGATELPGSLSVLIVDMNIQDPRLGASWGPAKHLNFQNKSVESSITVLCR